MRVLHVCLSAFFIDDRAYQENELVAEHRRQGHEVLVIASTQGHDAQGRRAYGEPGDYRLDDGVRVIRVPYVRGIPHFVVRSLRIHPGVHDLIAEFAPDTILFHGIAGWELLTVARYKQAHPAVRFYADTHTDAINSARGPISKWLLHKGFYRWVLHRSLPQIEKILCVSTLTQDFAREIYGVPDDKLEFYPLGGHPVDDTSHAMRRAAKRAELGVPEDAIVFVQSGKQSAPKYLKEALEAFAEVDDPRFRFFIAGVLMDDIREAVEALMAADPRVTFLGWSAPDALEDLLCAADVYVQPGRQSSTLQTSMCCNCAVVLENLPSHRVYVDGNGWLLDSPLHLKSVFEEIRSGEVEIDAMKARSIQFAQRMLDYSVLAQRVLP